MTNLTTRQWRKMLSKILTSLLLQTVIKLLLSYTDRHKHTSMSLLESSYVIRTHTQLRVDRIWEGEIKANKRGKGLRVKWQ